MKYRSIILPVALAGVAYFAIFSIAGIRVLIAKEQEKDVIVEGDYMVREQDYDGREGPKHAFPLGICRYWAGFGPTTMLALPGTTCKTIYRAYPLF